MVFTKHLEIIFSSIEVGWGFFPFLLGNLYFFICSPKKENFGEKVTVLYVKVVVHLSYFRC